MFSRFAKGLLVGTALAPLLVAYGLKKISEGAPILSWTAAQWFLYAAVLVVVCVCLLRVAQTRLGTMHFKVKSIKVSDKNALLLLASYLLPFLTKDQLDFEKNPIATAYFLVIMFVTVLVSNAFDFNPLLAVIGYHFYEVEDEDGMAFLLVSHRTLRKPTQSLEVAQIADYTFLDVGGRS